MNTFLKNLEIIEKKFPTEDSCKNYLIKSWNTQLLTCPKCQNRQFWRMKNSSLRCQNCQFKISFAHGKVFQGTKIPFKQWFKAVLWIIHQDKGIHAKEVQKIFNFGSNQTAWSFLHKLRFALSVPDKRLSNKVELMIATLENSKIINRQPTKQGDVGIIIAVESKKESQGEITANDIGSIKINYLNDYHLSNHKIDNPIPPGDILSILKRYVNKNMECFKYAKRFNEYKTTIYTDGYENAYMSFTKVQCHTCRTARKNLLLAEYVRKHFNQYMIDIYRGAVREEYFRGYINEYVFKMNYSHNKNKLKLFLMVLKNAVNTNWKNQ